MPINLIESERRAQKSLRGTFVSVAVHASLITLAVYATANAGQLKVSTPADTVITFYPPPEPTKNSYDYSRHPQRKTGPDAPLPLWKRAITYTTHIADSLPIIDTMALSTPAESLFSGSGSRGDARGDAGPAGTDSSEPMFAFQVDKPAVARDGNPIPKYPSVLESSRVEGSVLVQFVVDTLGKADMSTFKVLESSNDLFVRVFAETLPRWRFYPAEAGGRKVKQMVQLPLKFVAPQR